MKRLDFVLPEWTRIIWNSNSAKSVWEPRISQISKAFLNIEKNTVLQSIKPSWLTAMSPDEYAQTATSLEHTDFVVHALNKMPVSTSYTSSPQKYIEGQPFNYRVVLTKQSLLTDWITAWDTNNNHMIGHLLGFPKCCQDFFKSHWIDQQFLDTSWPMSLTGTHGPKECNILLRWLGVRAVSHLPCNFNCNETYQIARKNIDWAYQNGYAQEMEWLEEMLDWPVQWSALHGIAEIRTPILKISARTDATADLVVVDKQGFSYPAEGSSGTKFPYINKAKSIITKNNAFKRSILLEKQWQDNGFSTFEAMSHSHQILLKTLDNLDKTAHYDIIDFGCGNAELLKSIQQTKLKNSTIHGIEVDSDRFSRIKFNVDNLNVGDFHNNNMFDFSSSWVERRFDLVVLMPGRLTECNQEQRVTFLTWLERNSKLVLWYGYGDWVNKTGVSEPWHTMNLMNIEFSKTHSASSPACFAHLGTIQQKKASNGFQILG
jgi:2-polyprenyl-3-methyl-5-hydroxy-6-metoxy-1,4-benzoquinol methylase